MPKQMAVVTVPLVYYLWPSGLIHTYCEYSDQVLKVYSEDFVVIVCVEVQCTKYFIVPEWLMTDNIKCKFLGIHSVKGYADGPISMTPALRSMAVDISSSSTCN